MSIILKALTYLFVLKYAVDEVKEFCQTKEGARKRKATLASFLDITKLPWLAERPRRDSEWRPLRDKLGPPWSLAATSRSSSRSTR